MLLLVREICELTLESKLNLNVSADPSLNYQGALHKHEVCADAKRKVADLGISHFAEYFESTED
jgi:hypothetical protein